MNISDLKSILKDFKWGTTALAILSVHVISLELVPFIAEEIAKKFLSTVTEEGIGEIFGTTFKTTVNQGSKAFAVEGVEGLLNSEEAVKKASEIISKPLKHCFTALTAVGLGSGKVSNETLIEVQDDEYLLNNTADKAYASVKEVIDNVPLSRLRRNKCDDILARLNKADGIYKAAGSRWLVEENVDIFLKDMSNLGTGVLQNIKIKLLELGIDITQPSPLYAYP